MQKFRLLFEDDQIVAIDKPAGFHSHPPEDKAIRLSHRWNALGILQKQLNCQLFPSHRLDRATSGVLLFSKVRDLNHSLQSQFSDRSTNKSYYCLLRGAWNGSHEISEPLKADNGSLVEAKTHVTELFQAQLPILGPKGNFRIFTLAKATPITGRYHQIRRHLAHLGLPIINDNQHGDRKLNRDLYPLLGSDRLFLRCMELEFNHPTKNERMKVRASWGHQWLEAFLKMGFCPI